MAAPRIWPKQRKESRGGGTTSHAGKSRVLGTAIDKKMWGELRGLRKDKEKGFWWLRVKVNCEKRKRGFYTFRVKGKSGKGWRIYVYPKDVIVKVKKNDDDGIIRRIPRTSVEDRMFVRIIRILRVIEESVHNDCSGNYFLFKSSNKEFSCRDVREGIWLKQYARCLVVKSWTKKFQSFC